MAIEERHFHRMVKRKSNNNIKVACFGKLTVALICDSFEMIFGDVVLTWVVKKLSRNFKVKKVNNSLHKTAILLDDIDTGDILRVNN